MLLRLEKQEAGGKKQKICFQEKVTLYMNTLSQYYSHSTLHTPHSTQSALAVILNCPLGSAASLREELSTVNYQLSTIVGPTPTSSSPSAWRNTSVRAVSRYECRMAPYGW